MTGRITPAAVPFAAAALLTAAGLLSPPGTSLRETALEYAALSAGDPASAVPMMTDSLSGLVSPAAFSVAGAREVTGAPVLGRRDERGFQVMLPEEGGGSRTVWLRREGGGWRVSGDTFVDRVLGSAPALCRSFALSVVPEIIDGAPAGSFSCPVTGLPYGMDSAGGLLVCPAGHLGEGLEVAGDACGARRAEVASVVSAYISAGFPPPSSFAEIWEAGGGEYGQPGGYRCPDNGYSYYEIAGSTVYCPFHRAGTPITP